MLAIHSRATVFSMARNGDAGTHAAARTIDLGPDAFAGKDSNGRERYTSKTFHGSKKEAGIALAAFVTQVAKERTASSPAEAITVSQTLSKWLNW